MSDPVSPLGGRVAEDLAVGIADLGPQGMVTVRADLEAAAPALEAAGFRVPAPLTAVFDGARGAVWFSPDELLLRMPHAEAPGVVEKLREALAGTHHLVLDVSDARCVIGLTGAGVAEVLAKGAPVDLANFPPGTARRTHLGQIAIAFWRIGEEEWEVVALRSYAHHLWSWLTVSAKPGAQAGVF